jgi:hypothetical protein
VHLLDSNIQGALLLELYTRDGIGTMVSRYCSLALWFLLLYILLCISNSNAFSFEESVTCTKGHVMQQSMMLGV